MLCRLLALSLLPERRRSQLIRLMSLWTGDSKVEDNTTVNGRIYRLDDVESLAVCVRGATEVDHQANAQLPNTPALSVVKGWCVFKCMKFY